MWCGLYSRSVGDICLHMLKMVKVEDITQSIIKSNKNGGASGRVRNTLCSRYSAFDRNCQ